MILSPGAVIPLPVLLGLAFVSTVCGTLSAILALKGNDHLNGGGFGSAGAGEGVRQ